MTDSPSFTNGNPLQKDQSTTTSEKQSSFTKRILVVDDDPDITFTFRKGLEAENEKSRSDSSNKVLFKVNSCNDPLLALSEFRPGLYDLVLIDINMPKLDGIELSRQILELDQC